MEWYKRLGFKSEYYPPGFAILSRDEIQIFLQQQAGYVAPDDRGRRERHAWNVYIITDDVKGRIWRVTYNSESAVTQIAPAPAPKSATATSPGAAVPPEGVHPDAGRTALPVPQGSTAEQQKDQNNPHHDRLPFSQKLRFCAAAPFFGSMFTGLRRGPEPAPLSRYRFSRLACEASRWRLRFLIDRRRRFMPGLNFQLRLRHLG